MRILLVGLWVVLILLGCQDPTGGTNQSSQVTLTFVSNGGAGNMSPQVFPANGTAKLSANTYVKAGYTFGGWNTTSNGSGASFADRADFTIGDKNVSLYAQWDGPSWRMVGSGSFSQGTAGSSVLRIDSAGTPYVAYMDWANSLKVSVVKYSSGGWVQVGSPGFSTGNGDTPSLALDASGTPYVAYYDFSAGKTYVMRFSGTNWSVVGTAGFCNGAEPNIAFSPSGTLYCAYSDNVANGKASVMSFSGSTWVQVGTPGISAGVAYPRLVFSSSSVPYLAFADQGNSSKATVQKFNGASWVPVGNPGFSPGSVTTLSPSISSSGSIYVAFVDGNTTKATAMKFDGTNWGYVGPAGFSSGLASETSLAIDSQGTPYVAFTEGFNYASGYTSVMKFTGGIWSYAGQPQFSPYLSTSLSFQFSPGGFPYLAFCLNGSNNGAYLMTLQ